MTTPANPAGERDPAAALTPRLGTRSAHAETASLLEALYPDAKFAFRVLPGQTGVDVTVLGQESIDAVGFQFGEIKPLTASGEAAFGRQILNWNFSAPVQAITYDAAGNVFLGFQ